LILEEDPGDDMFPCDYQRIGGLASGQAQYELADLAYQTVDIKFKQNCNEIMMHQVWR
jgi:hypothetical protein